MDKFLDALGNLWETIGTGGIVMIAGLIFVSGAFASNKYLQLNIENWEVGALILIGLALLLLGLLVRRTAKVGKLKITQEGDILIVKSASADASNSQIKIRIDDIENERCVGNRVVALPVNSEFRDECLKRQNSSAGAYINACLGGSVDSRYDEILNLLNDVPQRIGSTKLVKNFLNMGDNIIFTAVTEKNDLGMITTTPINISYASQELVKTARANSFLEISCPVFGGGHGGVVAKTAIMAMMDGVVGAFGVFGCNNMTVTIRVHHKTFSSIKDVKKALRNE